MAVWGWPLVQVVLKSVPRTEVLRRLLPWGWREGRSEFRVPCCESRFQLWFPPSSTGPRAMRPQARLSGCTASRPGGNLWSSGSQASARPTYVGRAKVSACWRPAFGRVWHSLSVSDARETMPRQLPGPRAQRVPAEDHAQPMAGCRWGGRVGTAVSTTRAQPTQTAGLPLSSFEQKMCSLWARTKDKRYVRGLSGVTCYSEPASRALWEDTHAHLHIQQRQRAWERTIYFDPFFCFLKPPGPATWAWPRHSPSWLVSPGLRVHVETGTSSGAVSAGKTALRAAQCHVCCPSPQAPPCLSTLAWDQGRCHITLSVLKLVVTPTGISSSFTPPSSWSCTELPLFLHW